ncbi:hypothetical protein ACFW4X_23970 [Streptomyces smyrnaeus]|uniref:hypothetical protein n=1 Tax=Streptomyces smyrnaeus TaxID=1387713 RepID=UPI0033DE45A3
MEGTGDTEDYNADASRNTQARLSELEGLGLLKATFLGIASPAGIFGKVPNGAEAEEALRGAARGLLDELERAGISVENIVGNAGTVADIADMTDEEAALQNSMAAAAARAHGGNQYELE